MNPKNGNSELPFWRGRMAGFGSHHYRNLVLRCRFCPLSSSSTPMRRTAVPRRSLPSRSAGRKTASSPLQPLSRPARTSAKCGKRASSVEDTAQARHSIWIQSPRCSIFVLAARLIRGASATAARDETECCNPSKDLGVGTRDYFPGRTGGGSGARFSEADASEKSSDRQPGRKPAALVCRVSGTRAPDSLSASSSGFH